MTELALRFLLGAASVLVLTLGFAVTEESSCAAGQNCTAQDDQNVLLQSQTKRPPCFGKTCGDSCIAWDVSINWDSGRGFCSSEGKCLTNGEAPNCAEPSAQQHYCKRDAADYSCYKKGHPRCCKDGAKGTCPVKKPLCELPYVCQEREHFPCACTGTVYFGRKYARGYPGSGEAIPLTSLKTLGQFVTKKVAQEVTCAAYGFGRDPAVGYYKRCTCVPDQARDEPPAPSPPTPAPPPSASYKLMKRAGCKGGKKYSYHFIEDSKNCARAGKSLGLGDGQSRVIHDQWRPYGCYVTGKSAILYFNVKGDKTTRTSRYSSICVRQRQPQPCKKKVCGQMCVIGGDMAGMCTAEGECSLDPSNVDCGSFKKMSGATCKPETGFQFIESKKECRTAAVALGMEPKVGNSNSTKRPYGCYKYFRKDNGSPRIVFNSHGTKASRDRSRWSICAVATRASGPCASKACGSFCSPGDMSLAEVSPLRAPSACNIDGKCSPFLSNLKCEKSDSKVLVAVTSFWVHDDHDKDTWWGDKGDVYAQVHCGQDMWKSQVFHNTLAGDLKLYFYADTKCGKMDLFIMDKDAKGSETIMTSEINLDKRGDVRVKSHKTTCSIWGSCNTQLAADVTYQVYQGGAATGTLQRLKTMGATLTLADKLMD